MSKRNLMAVYDLKQLSENKRNSIKEKITAFHVQSIFLELEKELFFHAEKKGENEFEGGKETCGKNKSGLLLQSINKK